MSKCFEYILLSEIDKIKLCHLAHLLVSTTFKNVAYVFFLGFGAFYLTSDFLINQGQAQSETLQLIYKTFDMPFFFSAGMYALAAGYGQLKKKYNMGILSPLFWALAFAWTVLLISLNFGFESFL